MKRQPRKFRLWASFALLLLCVSLGETTLLSRISVFGVRFALLPIVVGLVAVLRGPVQGGIFGICAGLFWTLAGARSPAVVLTMALSGCVAGWLCDAVLTKNLLSAVLASAVSSLITLAFAGLAHAFFHGGSASVLLYALWQTLISLPFAVVLYYPVESIGRMDA